MTNQPLSIDAYAEILGKDEIDEIKLFAGQLSGVRVQQVNSTGLGGGVAEILSRLIPIWNELGVDVKWTVMEGSQSFFKVTKAFHNALHGERIKFSDRMKKIYRETSRKNLSKIDLDCDFIIIHDPQPLGLSKARKDGKSKWIWRCHIDVARADRAVWGFLRPYMEPFDAVLFHLPEYAKDLHVDQYLVPPAIDPLSEKNRKLSKREIDGVMDRFGIDREKPIILQVSRFDRLKDPVGVIQAFKMVRRDFDCQLVLLGGQAADDPEGKVVLSEVLRKAEGVPDIHVLEMPLPNDLEVNAFQRAAKVVVQKSLREGFGLVVAEAMLKGKPIVGTNVGGIRRQVIHGVTGFLVETVEGTAFRIRQLLSDSWLAERMGEAGKEYVKSNYLLPHYLKKWMLVLLAQRYPERGVVEL
jgi:trehalose synthase